MQWPGSFLQVYGARRHYVAAARLLRCSHPLCNFRMLRNYSPIKHTGRFKNVPLSKVPLVYTFFYYQDGRSYLMTDPASTLLRTTIFSNRAMRGPISRCEDFKETAKMIYRLGIKRALFELNFLWKCIKNILYQPCMLKMENPHKCKRVIDF